MRRAPFLVVLLVLVAACGGEDRDGRSPSAGKPLPNPCAWVKPASLGEPMGTTFETDEVSKDTCVYRSIESRSSVEITLTARRLDDAGPSLAAHREKSFADLVRPVTRPDDSADEAVIAVGRPKAGGQQLHARGVAREGDGVLVVALDQNDDLQADALRDYVGLVLAVAALEKFEREL